LTKPIFWISKELSGNFNERDTNGRKKEKIGLEK
jgi:hypothetical protein